MQELVLPDSLAVGLASGHPWVYRDHVARAREKTGAWVSIRAASFRAFGLWDDESPIAVRIFSSVSVPTAQWFRARIEEAWALRAPLRNHGVTGFRWVYGEGDGLPGLVVDWYDGYAVVMTYAKSIGAILPAVVQAIDDVARPKGIVRRIRHEEGGAEISLLRGEMPPEVVNVQEYGMALEADLFHGQKTGLFFDHRENRAFVKERAHGLRVLNLFSYTGGFSVAAALGGATQVTSVDIAPQAVEASRRNFELNGLPAASHDAVAADVFAFLEKAAQSEQRWDLVVCDPPSFAKSREQKKNAERGYVRLMTSALRLVAPGGLFCAASCTSQIGPAEFRILIADAARKSKLRFQTVWDVGQPLDHPILIGHEEGRYLKFVVGRISPRV
jgi:23S rRNA (cytosine1962-C5)-methyltransferase